MWTDRCLKLAQPHVHEFFGNRDWCYELGTVFGIAGEKEFPAAGIEHWPASTTNVWGQAARHRLHGTHADGWDPEASRKPLSQGQPDPEPGEGAGPMSCSDRLQIAGLQIRRLFKELINESEQALTMSLGLLVPAFGNQPARSDQSH